MLSRPSPPQRVRLLAALALASAAPAQTSGDRGDDFTFAHENILGTSLRMCVHARDEQAAHQLEQAVLREIDRLAHVVSTWDADSELRRALRSTEAVEVSPELAEVVTACDHWRERTHGAFHAGVGVLVSLWQTAVETGAEPKAEDLAAAAASLTEPAWSFDARTRRLAPRPGTSVTVDALAKGYILEKASDVHVEHASLHTLEIGGDVRVRASEPRAVSVKDPRHPADNATPLAVVRVRNAAVASSGGYARGFDVGGVHHSHLLDPRTGRPCDAVLGSTVIAPDATTADALATIVSVLGPVEGIALLDSVDGSAGVVVGRDGKVCESKAWRGFVDPTTPAAPAAAAAGPPWPEDFEFSVDLEIRGPSADGASGRRRRGGYRRPYVAVWIENSTGVAVRTLALWVEQPRWLSDLRRWYKHYRRDGDYVDAISGATRKPGKYSLTWDGIDDYGDKVAKGAYVLCIEAAREHGTYQCMRQPVEIGDAAFAHTMEGNQEIAGASVRLGKGEPK
ncbi:MAG: DUF2271 domain-containing protein [Planctomycetota bacterium]